MTRVMIRQLAGFAISGGICFFIDAGLYALTLPWVGMFWAKQLSFVLATVASFFLNRHLTFANKATPWGRIVLFFVYYLVMAWANPALNWLLASWFQNAVAGFLAVTVVTAVANFVFQRWVVFRT
jgi:putative flippase GtrA